MLEKIDWEEFIKISSPQYYVLLVTSAENKVNLTGISWFSIVSWEPPMVMFSIGEARFGYELLKKNPEFVISFPSKKQEKGAILCGHKSGRSTDKVKEGGFRLRKADIVGVPLIDESTACIECRVEKELPVADHVIVVGRVVACHGDFDNPYHIYTTSYTSFYSLDFSGRV
jgi:flavin reductase (DIM6/NTAB) family NADH-FMN oxidoreductase RutF